MISKSNIFIFSLVFALFISLSGCRTAPIYNPTDIPLNSKAKMADVEKAIVRAGKSLRWNMKTVKPGFITATLYNRSHTAIVDITYTTKSFSIQYKDSVDLNYDGNTMIHKNYNNWVTNLERKIQMEVSSL